MASIVRVEKLWNRLQRYTEAIGSTARAVQGEQSKTSGCNPFNDGRREALQDEEVKLVLTKSQDILAKPITQHREKVASTHNMNARIHTREGREEVSKLTAIIDRLVNAREITRTRVSDRISCSNGMAVGDRVHRSNRERQNGSNMPESLR